MAMLPRTTLALEEMLILGAHHAEKTVDAHGRTYFDVFLTQPPEMVFDWPDYVDLPARYWESAAMMAPALGKLPAYTPRVRQWLFSHFEADGLAYRPESGISHHIPEMFDQSRLLYALVSWAMFDPNDQDVRQRITHLAGGLMSQMTHKEDYVFIKEIGLYFGGTLIRPLFQAGLVMKNQEWVDAAGGLARGLMHHSDLIGRENGYFKGHVHGALSAIAGTLAYAVYTGDNKLLERAKLGFDYARNNLTTEFGFIEEVAHRDDDLIACETCTLMDYLDAALLLARHVDAGYWDIIEKAARNHLWESQIRDGSWFGKAGGEDQEDIIRTQLNDRVIGSFAGWSAPHCQLAYHENLHPNWTHSAEKKPLYLNKIRATQNCCAGGGVRAVYQVWSNIITAKGDQVQVNLSLDRATDDVQVISYLPFEGRVVLKVRKDCQLSWRRPSHATPTDITVRNGNGAPVAARHDGAYLLLGMQKAGETIELTFPLPERTEHIALGNKGFKTFGFSIAWRGDTVMSVAPDKNNASMAFSFIDQCQTKTYYAETGLGPIYQRKDWALGLKVEPAKVVAAPAIIDWYSLSQ